MPEDDSDGGPKRVPEARSKKEREAAEKTCRFLGKTFYEGQTICYEHLEWKCSDGSWARTNRSC